MNEPHAKSINSDPAALERWNAAVEKVRETFVGPNKFQTHPDLQTQQDTVAPLEHETLDDALGWFQTHQDSWLIVSGTWTSKGRVGQYTVELHEPDVRSVADLNSYVINECKRKWVESIYAGRHD